jgi:hypothetical protein
MRGSGYTPTNPLKDERDEMVHKSCHVATVSSHDQYSNKLLYYEELELEIRLIT